MGVGRPWGVTLFWILLCLVVPAAVFRIGMAIVDKVRPRTGHGAGRMAGRQPVPARRGDREAPETAARPGPGCGPRTAPGRHHGHAAVVHP